MIITDDQVVLRPTVSTSGDIFQFPTALRRIQISNEGANVLRIYRRAVDFTNDANYIDLPASTGFYDGPHVGRSIWLRANGGSTSVIMTVYVADGITTG